MTSEYRHRLTSPRLAVPLTVLAALAGFLILSAVGRSPPAKVARSPATAPTVQVRHTRLGRVLVTTGGRTLYLFLEDGSHSSCFAGCARVWPPLLVTGRPRAGPGVDARKLKTVRRRHSRLRQVTYAGHPLYTTVADERPGDTQGQGWLGTWFVISPAGRQVGKASASAGGY
jgi:predicted lipoprotein with Yx(FWY)xxD motif